MKTFLRLALCLGLSALSFVSCDDELSRIGESVQTRRDVVESEQYNLQFESKSVKSLDTYNAGGTAGLLGAYSDEDYGSFRADFITQLRNAPGFTFTHTPEGGRIDSVELRLIFGRNDYVGSEKAPMQISVYEVPKGFTGSEYSQTSLDSYADESKLLGERVIHLAQDTTSYSYGANGRALGLSIKLNRELGERFYKASLNNKDYFSTQKKFNDNLLGGLYVTVSSGSGAVIKVQATDLVIHYQAKADTANIKATESFINTRLTAHADGINNEIKAELFTDADYTYSKGPAGVQTAIVLPKAQMERLLASQPAGLQIGTNWTLADTQFKIEIDNPSTIQLNPPAYMMLMPVDSVPTYFKRGMTERTQSATSYLSTAYSTASAYYNFFNVSRVITEHLKQHAKHSAGKWSVAEDLELRLVPVERITSQSGSSVITAEINEYLYPNFVRFKKDPSALKIGVVVSVFK